MSAFTELYRSTAREHGIAFTLAAAIPALICAAILKIIQ